VNQGPDSYSDRGAVEPELEWPRSREAAIWAPKLKTLSIYACLLFLTYGCARVLPTYEPADMPVSLVLERLEQRQNHLVSYRGVGTLRVQGGKKRWSGKAFILSHFPDSLRLEVVSMFGQPVLFAASDGGQFLLWEPDRNRAYQGPASGRTLARLIEFPLQDQEALLILAGTVPPWYQAEAKLFRIRGTESLMLQLDGVRGGPTQRVWLEREGLVVTKIERTLGGERQLQASFSDFVKIEGFYYPRDIVMEGAKARLSLRYQQFVVNEKLDESVFHLALPDGVEIVPW
jgi:hypothetical protein